MSLARRRETFAGSLIGQAAILAVIIYFTSFVIPGLHSRFPIPDPRNSLVFYGTSGGGGARDPLPASKGDIPSTRPEAPIVPAAVMVPKEMPKLAVPESVMAPDIQIAASGQIGDPNSRFSEWLSNGKGGPGGIGDEGCCDGIGNSDGPRVGTGPRGIYIPGKGGVSIPVAIYSPEPTFSDEARKQKWQGTVTLMLIVGKDGRPYNIHVRQSVGMGLDEQALETVKNWRFRPASLNGQPVDARIAVEVNFRLY
jgi:TonB family protein